MSITASNTSKIGTGPADAARDFKYYVMNGRYAGIDYGIKRIGLSISDPAGTIASPFKTVIAPGNLRNQVREVVAALEEYDIEDWVVGWPLNMDGSTGPQAKLSQQFADHLAKATGSPVHLWDERLSSQQADVHLDLGGLTKKKKKRRRDAVAAQVILQTYLDARPQVGA